MSQWSNSTDLNLLSNIFGWCGKLLFKTCGRSWRCWKLIDNVVIGTSVTLTHQCSGVGRKLICQREYYAVMIFSGILFYALVFLFIKTYSFLVIVFGTSSCTFINSPTSIQQATTTKYTEKRELLLPFLKVCHFQLPYVPTRVSLYTLSTS